MIEELLKTGREQATPTAELLRLCGLGSARDLQVQIARERAAGVLICSTTTPPGGYFLPGDRAEVERFVKSMDSRAREIFRAVAAARKYLREMEAD